MTGGAVDTAVSSIRDGIFTGRFAPGQRLVEQDLMNVLAIGRSSIREALQRLATEGMVELVRNKGAVVRQLTRAEAEEILEIRETLEGMAAEKAARNIDYGANREILEKSLADMDEPGRFHDQVSYNRINIEFHRTIVAIAGNRNLGQILEQLQTQMFFSQFRHSLNFDNVMQSIEQHREIADAILRGDPAGARKAMKRHVGRSQEMVTALPESDFRPSRPPYSGQ